MNVCIKWDSGSGARYLKGFNDNGVEWCVDKKDAISIDIFDDQENFCQTIIELIDFKVMVVRL